MRRDGGRDMDEHTTPPDGSAAPENSIETLRHEIDAELAAAREEAERLRAMADDAAKEEAALHEKAEALRASTPPAETEEAAPGASEAQAAPKSEEEPADKPTEPAEPSADTTQEPPAEAPDAPAPRRGLLAKVAALMRRQRR